MKKFFAIALIVATAMTALSCKKDNGNNDPEEKDVVTHRIVTMTVPSEDGDEVWTYSYDGQGRVKEITASWAGDEYSDYEFAYDGTKLVVTDNDIPLYEITLNDKGLAKEIVKAEDEVYTYEYDADGYLKTAKLNGTECSNQAVQDGDIEYWARAKKNDDGSFASWRHKDHKYSTTLNIAGIHSEWNEDAGMKRWFYETGLLGKASQHVLYTAQWNDAEKRALYEMKYDNGCIANEIKNYGAQGAEEFDYQVNFTCEPIPAK